MFRYIGHGFYLQISLNVFFIVMQLGNCENISIIHGDTVGLSHQSMFNYDHKSTACRFIMDIILKFNMTFPKIFVPEYDLGRLLYMEMFDRSIQGIVRLNHDQEILLQLIYRDQAQSQVIIIASDEDDVGNLLRLGIKSKLLQRFGIFIVICFNCPNVTVNVDALDPTYSLYSNVILATPTRQDKIMAMNLQFMTYSYKMRRLQCQPLGSWNSLGSFKVGQLPSHGSSLDNSSLQILSSKMPHYLDSRMDSSRGLVPTGFIGDIIILLSEMLHFSINVTVSGSDVYEDLHPNGTSSGVLKEFVDGKFDVAIGIYSRTTRRDRVVGFTIPYGVERLMFVTRLPSGSGQDSGHLVRQLFKGYLWVAVIGMVAVVFICSSIITKCGKCQKDIDPGEIALTVSLNQGLTKMPKSTASRIVITASSLCFWTVSCYCSTYLISILTVDQPQLMTSLADLVQSKYRWGVNRGTSAIDVIKTSQSPVMRTIGSRSLTIRKSIAYNLVCHEDRYAHLFGLDWIQLLMKSEQLCDAYVIKEDLLRDPLHFLTKKDDRFLREVLSNGIHKLKESGLLSRLKHLHGHTGLVENDNWSQTKAFQVQEGLHLFQISEVFFYLYIGICMALIMLVLEIIFYKYLGSRFNEQFRNWHHCCPQKESNTGAW